MTVEQRASVRSPVAGPCRAPKALLGLRWMQRLPLTVSAWQSQQHMNIFLYRFSTFDRQGKYSHLCGETGELLLPTLRRVVAWQSQPPHVVPPPQITPAVSDRTHTHPHTHPKVPIYLTQMNKLWLLLIVETHIILPLTICCLQHYIVQMYILIRPSTRRSWYCFGVPLLLSALPGVESLLLSPAWYRAPLWASDVHNSALFSLCTTCRRTNIVRNNRALAAFPPLWQIFTQGFDPFRSERGRADEAMNCWSRFHIIY